MQYDKPKPTHKPRNKKMLRLAIMFLVILEVPLFLYLLNFKAVVFNVSLHQQEFKKYNIYEKFKDRDIYSIHQEVIDYLKDEKNTLETDFFIAREKSHLGNVKRLIAKAQQTFFLVSLTFIFFIVLLYYMLEDKKTFLKYFSLILIIGAFLTLLYSLLLGIMIRYDFSNFFTRFHQTFFEKGTWMFDPSYENIVNLYPEGFFYDMGYRIIIGTLVSSFIGLVIGFILHPAISKKLFKVALTNKGI